MNEQTCIPKEADEIANAYRPRFSICSLVTDIEQYSRMRASFRDAGFQRDCEYIYVDNSRINKLDGYAGLNLFLSNARGEYVIICHQDVLLSYDNRQVLEKRLEELTQLDPYWAVCGNAGLTPAGENAIRITDPHGANVQRGPFPSKVVGLDENFIITRSCWRLCVTPHLKGFHLYATELTTVAQFLGLSSYVIDFHLHHLSRGSPHGFDEAMKDLVSWRSQYLRSHVIGNTCGAAIVGSPITGRLASLLLKTPLRALVYRMLR